MSMTGHPTFEELSAYYDGEAPEWAGHVEGCAVCRPRLDEMAAVTSALASQLPAVPAAVGEQAMAEAISAESTGRRARAKGGRNGRWVVVGSVAASLAAVVGAVALLAGRGDGPSTERTLNETVRSPQAADSEASGGGAAPGNPSDIDAAVLGGELGEMPDAQTLAARVAPVLRAAPPAPEPPPAEVGTKRVVGTRPCELEARQLDPALTSVVYVATATRNGSPVVVLGFTRRGGPVTLYAMSQDGCRLLFSTPL